MSSAAALEQLEPRALFSAPYEFASVGFRFDDANSAVFEMLGSLADNGTVTGTQTFAQLAGAPVSGPIDYATFLFHSKGRLTTAPGTGVDPYDTEVGTSFFNERGYAFGSLFGEFTNGPTDISFIVQRLARDPMWGLGGNDFEFQYLEFSSEGFSIRAGEFQVTNDGVLWSDSADGEDPVVIGLTSEDEFGTLRLANGVNIHTNYALQRYSAFDPVYASGGVHLIVDTDNSDGKIGIGVGRRFFPGSNLSTNQQGLFRTSILTDGDVAADFFDAHDLTGGIASARIALDLRVDGTYAIYDLAAYDTGGRTALSTGDWFVEAPALAGRLQRLVLRADSTGNHAVFLQTPDYAIVPYYVSTADGTTSHQMTGGGTSFTTINYSAVPFRGQVVLDDQGHPIFYQPSDVTPETDPRTTQWYSQDLVESWGGKPLAAVESFDSSSGKYRVVGVATDGDVLTWDREYNGRWIFRNITAELNAAGLVSDIALFNHFGQETEGIHWYQAIAAVGKNADGEIVMYVPSHEEDAYGAYGWSVINVTEDGLEPFGETTPDWTDRIYAYQTAWGGLNIVGLDAAGDLIVVWTAPGAGQWHTSNLSDIAGTPTLTGAVNVIMTQWRGIHIYGLDAQGALHVTWWVPQFGGAWEHNNLTTQFNGPAFDATRQTDRLDAFITFNGVGSSLNIAGFDAQGRIRVYWWSASTDEWLVGDITDSFPVQDAPLGFVASNGLGDIAPEDEYHAGQSMYGFNADGDLLRVWWAHGGPDVWHVENVSDLAIMINA